MNGKNLMICSKSRPPIFNTTNHLFIISKIMFFMIVEPFNCQLYNTPEIIENQILQCLLKKIGTRIL